MVTFTSIVSSFGNSDAILGTIDRFYNTKATHLFGAKVCNKVDGKSNEIIVITVLLDLLDIDNSMYNN
jgi:hypothetical protein